MSGGLEEMNKSLGKWTHPDGTVYDMIPEQGETASCYGCCFVRDDINCSAGVNGEIIPCQEHDVVFKVISPLATASAELASQGRPLVAESIIRGANEAIIAEGVRTFDTGATRDTDEGKHDIEAFFSPLVTKRRAEYMHLHRKLGDGSMRDGDNWQLGMPYNECLKSLCRHVEDIKLLSRGYDAREDIETALCAVMFNCESMLLTRLEEKT